MIEQAAPHCEDGSCVTCGDVAEPARVLAADSDRGLALCAGPAGERWTVEIALVAPVAEGDELLVHAGTALARLAAPQTRGSQGGRPAANPAAPGRAAEGQPAANPGTPGREAEEVPG